MKKIGYALFLTISVMLAGCNGHGGGNTVTDSIATTQTDGNTEGGRDVDSSNSDTTQVFVRQNNEEEDINAGLFSKKERKVYAAEQLCGEWVCGTLHEMYNSDSTGLQWDTKDDVGREEAQKFTWQLENNNLQHVYSMRLGGVVPRTYKVTFVDDESLVYRDNFGESYMWERSN